jgi:hypothetical protein
MPKASLSWKDENENFQLSANFGRAIVMVIFFT